jgi:hypothetical protein
MKDRRLVGSFYLRVNADRIHYMIDEAKSGFTAYKVSVWRMSKAQVFDGSGQGPQEFRDGPEAVQLACNKCGTAWICRESSREHVRGTFYRLPLALYVTCKSPSCDNHALLPNVEIPN